jgi:hypothetical protein
MPWLAVAPLVSAMPMVPCRLHVEIAPVIMCHSPDSDERMMKTVCSTRRPDGVERAHADRFGIEDQPAGDADQPARLEPAFGHAAGPCAGG